MIRIDHTAVHVRDLEGMRSFYQRYFNARTAFLDPEGNQIEITA